MANPTDADLRATAFRAHVQPEIEVLLRVALTLTRHPADAEDLVQETLVRAWRGLDTFDGSHPRAWLLTILRNTHTNLHRRRRPDLVDGAVDLPGARPAFGTDEPPTPEDSTLGRMLPEDLERAVDSLAEPFRSTLLLVDVDGLNYAEAAEVLDVPVGTVESRLSRARERVRRHLRAHTSRGRSTRS